MNTVYLLPSLLVGIALLSTACTPPIMPAEANLVHPPIPSLTPAYQDFTINTQEESILTLPSGTVITVPANALVDGNGQSVKGEATLRYREYHDAASVILSGIPMSYNSNGREQHFQTAGMFDIAGQQDNKALAIAPESTIRVDLASFEAGTDYNFFTLEQGTGWKFVDYVAPTPNPQQETLDNEINALSKKVGRTVSPYFVFSYDGVLDVSYTSNPLSAKNRANSKLRRKFNAYQIDSYASRVFKYIKYENTTYPADMLIWKNLGKRFPSWLRDKPCSVSLTPIEGKTYKVTAEYSGKTFEGKIRILVPLKYLFDYSPESWKNNIATVLKDIGNKEEKYREELEQLRLRREQQAAVIRSFSIAGFGIYNYDRLQKEPDAIEVLADFEVENNDAIDWVLYLPEDGKTIIKYPKSSWDKVVLLPNNKARFLSILPDKRLVLYSVEEYQALDFDGLLKSAERPTVKVTFKNEPKALESEAALRDLLQKPV